MLSSKVALITGSSRGIGRGIGLQLGKAGATVYVTALPRSKEDAIVQSVADKLPTLEDTANEINRRGGKGIPIYCDHSNDQEVEALFERIGKEQHNQLDILVNCAWSAVTLMLKVAHQKFYDLPMSVYDEVNGVGLRGTYMTSRLAAQMMVPNKKGLIINVSSPGGLTYVLNVAYGLAKAAKDKMAADMACQLKESNIACISLWPCTAKTELFGEECGLVKMEHIQELFKTAPSQEFAGQCVVALAADPNIMSKTGHILTDFELAKEYGFKDEADGSQPWCATTSNYLDLLKQINEVRKNVSM